jgi:hypothetical protein
MREHLPKHVDAITVVAFLLMAISGTMAVRRFLTTEQPGMAADIQLTTARY